MIKSILKIIIGVFIYYILSFFIFELYMWILLWRCFIIAPITFVIFTLYFIVDKTFILICLLVLKKNRCLIFNKLFIISQALYACMNMCVASYLSDLIDTDKHSYTAIYIYVILNILFIILFSYIYNRRKISSVNPLKNVFYLLFNMNDKKLRIKDYTYINVVMSLIIYVFLMILLNVIAIYCANCGIKKI